MKDVQAALNKGEAEMKDVMKKFEDSMKKELGAAFGVPVEASEDIPSCQAFFKSVMKSGKYSILNFKTAQCFAIINYFYVHRLNSLTLKYF